jgi:hypothetical protein
MSGPLSPDEAAKLSAWTRSDKTINPYTGCKIIPGKATYLSLTEKFDILHQRRELSKSGRALKEKSDMISRSLELLGRERAQKEKSDATHRRLELLERERVLKAESERALVLKAELEQLERARALKAESDSLELLERARVLKAESVKLKLLERARELKAKSDSLEQLERARELKAKSDGLEQLERERALKAKADNLERLDRDRERALKAKTDNFERLGRELLERERVLTAKTDNLERLGLERLERERTLKSQTDNLERMELERALKAKADNLERALKAKADNLERLEHERLDFERSKIDPAYQLAAKEAWAQLVTAAEGGGVPQFICTSCRKGQLYFPQVERVCQFCAHMGFAAGRRGGVNHPECHCRVGCGLICGSCGPYAFPPDFARFLVYSTAVGTVRVDAEHKKHVLAMVTGNGVEDLSARGLTLISDNEAVRYGVPQLICTTNLVVAIVSDR